MGELFESYIKIGFGRFLKKAPQKLSRLGAVLIRVNFTPTTCAGSKTKGYGLQASLTPYPFILSPAPRTRAMLEIYLQLQQP